MFAAPDPQPLPPLTDLDASTSADHTRDVSLDELAEHLVANGPVKVETTSRRVRVILKGHTIVDTTRARLVWEHAFFPQYWVPIEDLKDCDLGRLEPDVVPFGIARYAVTVTIPSPDHESDDDEVNHLFRTDRVLAFERLGPPGIDDFWGRLAKARELYGLVRLEFGSMDQWLEEDVPIYVHPKDPYKRVDLLPSTRPVEVGVEGQTVASSPYSVHLLETGLPTRYYMPVTAVDQTMLRPSDHVTRCPYKGEAEYYHVVVGDGRTAENAVWYYRNPTVECAGIKGMVCFYNEKVSILLDGELLQRPETPFS